MAAKDDAEFGAGAVLGRYERVGMVQGHATREDVAALNRLARGAMRTVGELGTEHQVETERGRRAMAAGERVMFLRNERGLGAGRARGRGGQERHA